MLSDGPASPGTACCCRRLRAAVLIRVYGRTEGDKVLWSGYSILALTEHLVTRDELGLFERSDADPACSTHVYAELVRPRRRP